jgi:dCTP deaminase
MLHPWDEGHWLPGVLSKNQMKELYEQEYICGIDNFASAADFSSIDLHISAEAYKMRHGSIKPCGKKYSDILDNPDHSEELKPDEDGIFKLDAKKCYVFKLKEHFTVHYLDQQPIYGQATAKSSVGRVDVIARLIVDGMYRYESMDPENIKNGMGRMYLEIIPISFNVMIKEGISLSQLRLFYGNISNAQIIDKTFIKGILHGSEDGEGFLSVNINNTTIGGLDVAAFCANQESTQDEFIPLWNDGKNKLPDPCNYWLFKKADPCNRLEITSGDFYIIRSKEKISLPAGVAVYARPMDESLGEMRIHYAGFAHPFFGMNRPDDEKGTPLIFEVRGHHVNVNLSDGERLAKLNFYRMSENAEAPQFPVPYGLQDLTLSNFFGEWPKNLRYIDEKTGSVEKDE